MTIKDRFPNWTRPKIIHLEFTKWKWLVAYPNNFFFADYIDIGAFTYINARYNVIIEKNVEIGSHCSIYSHNSIDDIKGEILIKEGAKIGSHCVINPGVVIGKNSVVAAFSFVKENIPDGQTWAGVPAKRIK